MFSSANEQLKKAGEDATDEILVQVMFEKIVSCGNDYKSEEVSPDFQDMTLGEFEMLAEDYVSKKISVCLSLPNTPSAFKDSFIETLFYILRSKYHVYSNSTGLVFFGYGDQELLHLSLLYLMPYMVQYHSYQRQGQSPIGQTLVFQYHFEGHVVFRYAGDM